MKFAVLLFTESRRRNVLSFLPARLRFIVRARRRETTVGNKQDVNSRFLTLSLRERDEERDSTRSGTVYNASANVSACKIDLEISRRCWDERCWDTLRSLITGIQRGRTGSDFYKSLRKNERHCCLKFLFSVYSREIYIYFLCTYNIYI